MKIIDAIILFCLVFGVVSTSSSQTFSCDGQLLIALNDSTTTTIFRPVPIPFNPPFFSPVSRYTGGSFDALGFNSKDNYIYGIEKNTNNIVRLKRNNTYEVIGTLESLDPLSSFAGDCTPDGLYLVYDYESHHILVYEVTDAFQLIDEIDLYWDPASGISGDFTNILFDFAVDPNRPSLAYSYQGIVENPELGPVSTRGSMLEIIVDLNAPNKGMVTPRQKINDNIISHIGAFVFSPQSGLHGYGTSEEGFNPRQNRLFSVNAFNGDIGQVLSYSPAAIYSDGCSCPFSFIFSNSVPSVGIFCNNDEKTFKLRIDNNTFIPVEDVILRDTFPDGIVIKQVVGDFEGNITNGVGIGLGSNILEITELLIPEKTTVEIEVTVLSIDAVTGPVYNQAFLENLPDRYNGRMVSNDPATVGVDNDPSRYFVVEQDLEDVSWQIISPTDCINGNDGKIIFSSEQFFPGQSFEVGLRNKIGWEENVYSVIIDDNNSFMIDSLIRGDYEVFNFRSLSDNCSLKLRDTTLIIEPPNELLILETSTNSPVCEGSSLQLNGMVSPAGTIRWTGPGSFGSDVSNSIIEETDPNRSGTYRASAIYGFCMQEIFEEVDIKPEVNISIDGTSEVCERDTLRLKAMGTRQEVEYNWNKDDRLITVDSILLILDVTPNDSGIIELIADNGACRDTARLEVDILPTPTLELPREISSDFCDPIILTPEITGDTDVSYQWIPQEGLDCSECLNPQIQPLVQSNYMLKVENDYQCSDSASVNIFLDKRNLIFAPNVFLRSSQNQNDIFEVTAGCTTRYIHSLDIYDRWGGVAFSSLNNTLDSSIGYWDGYINDRPAKSGVYIWFAKIELVDATIEYISGDVTLLIE
jgi:hypothetical protein